MNLPKAIEILELNVKEDAPMTPPGTLNALKLGIEALKAIEKWRHKGNGHLLNDLPGETPDAHSP